MLRKSYGFTSVVLSCHRVLLLLGLSACTFPTVDYLEPGETDPPCATPPKCVGDVSTCSKQAEAQRGACVSQCGSGPTKMGAIPDCAGCDAAYDTAMNVCVAQCESCSAAEGCTNATDSCKALLGLP